MNKNTIIEYKGYFEDAYPNTPKYHTEMLLRIIFLFKIE